jgi:hypothetical protein
VFPEPLAEHGCLSCVIVARPASDVHQNKLPAERLAYYQLGETRSGDTQNLNPVTETAWSVGFGPFEGHVLILYEKNVPQFQTFSFAL